MAFDVKVVTVTGEDTCYHLVDIKTILTVCYTQGRSIIIDLTVVLFWIKVEYFSTSLGKG